MNKFTYIDLFAGAGGLSEGFYNNNFKPIAHVEMDLSACYTLTTRAVYHYLVEQKEEQKYISYLKGEITRDQLYKDIPKEILNSIINLSIGEENNKTIHSKIKNLLKDNSVDLIIGGPPCQAYSLAGRARSKTKMVGDPRNYLFVQYAAYLEKYQPKMFVFENVLGLKSANNGQYLREMQELFEKLNYKLKLSTIEARNFGVLQNRKRIIIIGWKKSLKIEVPDLEEINIDNNFVVNDLLKDLPPLKAGEGLNKNLCYHSGATKYLEIFKIRNEDDILTQHVSRPQRKEDLEIYKIAVNKWNTNRERLNYNNLPDTLKTHKNRSSFFDRFKVVASDLPYSQVRGCLFRQVVNIVHSFEFCFVQLKRKQALLRSNLLGIN